MHPYASLVAHQSRLQPGIILVQEAALVAVHMPAKDEIIQESDRLGAAIDPAELDSATRQRGSDKPTIEAHEERVAEGARMAPADPVGLMQCRQPIQHIQRLANVPRPRDAERAALF